MIAVMIRVMYAFVFMQVLIWMNSKKNAPAIPSMQPVRGSSNLENAANS